MSFIFGGQAPTVADMARRYKTNINRQIRELERENMKLQVEEKSLFREMKKHAQTNPKVTLQKAKAVVRVRRIAQKFESMVGNLQGVSAKISSVKSMDALNKTMESVAALMTKFNATPAIANMGRTIAHFARENQSMLMKSEMLDDSLDEIFDENEEEESSDLVESVLVEANIELPQTSAAKFETVEERFERLKIKNELI